MKLEIAGLSLLFTLFPCPSVIAQISSDGTLSTTITTDDSVNFLIENGDQLGENLFHSFSEFSIPNFGEAYFNNATNITNIFTRVTGGNISDIQGLIRANGTANFFLINPAGIVFGENASLDVGGSFFASTGESFVFGDGIEFSATQPQEAPLLTINITPGVQFGNNPGDIIVNGMGHNISVPNRQQVIRNGTSSQLQVLNGNTLALVGGNITVNGGVLKAENGRVELISVYSPDLVQVNSTELGITLENTNISQFGDIKLTERSLVEASEIGAIKVQSNYISVQNGSLLLIENLGNQEAQSIDIQATQTVEFTNSNPETPSRNGVISDTLTSGTGGDISIIAPRVIGNNNGGNLRAFTFGEGNSGNITLEVEKIDLIGVGTTGNVIEVRSLSSGNGGHLTINTDKLNLHNSPVVNSVSNNGSGLAGNIIINATEEINITSSVDSASLISSSSISPTGSAGSITINTSRFSMDGALLSSSTYGTGNAGTITINATESIALNGSRLNVFTNQFEPTRITTSGILLPSSLRQRLGLTDTVTGDAGEVILNTSLLQVTNDAQVTVQHDSLGNAGTLQVNADQIILEGGGNISAFTQSGDGGNISLQVQDSVQLKDGSFINTEAFGEGNGGNINLDTNNLVILENSSVSANAIQGNGGNIFIDIKGLFLSPDSGITASSQFGIDGLVTINSPSLDNSIAVIELSTNLMNSNQTIVKVCGEGEDNTFTATGRGGLPNNPEQVFNSDHILEDLGDFSSQTNPNISSPISKPFHAQESLTTIVEANAWIINEQGNLEFVAIVPNSNQNLGKVAQSCNDEVGLF